MIYAGKVISITILQRCRLRQNALFIISDKYEEIGSKIIDMKVVTALIFMEGMYNGDDKALILPLLCKRRGAAYTSGVLHRPKSLCNGNQCQ